MSVRYNPLWKMLIDRKMNKSQLRIGAGISTRAMAKMGKDQDVSTEVLSKICTFLQCDLSDIVELVPDSEKAAEAGEKA